MEERPHLFYRTLGHFVEKTSYIAMGLVLTATTIGTLSGAMNRNDYLKAAGLAGGSVICMRAGRRMREKNETSLLEETSELTRLATGLTI